MSSFGVIIESHSSTVLIILVEIFSSFADQYYCLKTLNFFNVKLFFHSN